MWIWGLGGLDGAIFIVNVIKRIGKQFLIIILPHSGLECVRIHFGETRKLFMFMFALT